jgi:hypothetical protein
MDKEDLEFFLTNLVRQIGIIPLADLEAHVEACERSVSNADSIGVMLDPTGWMRARNTGEFDMAKGRNAMARNILEIRRLMEADEKLRQEYLKRTVG